MTDPTLLFREEALLSRQEPLLAGEGRRGQEGLFAGGEALRGRHRMGGAGGTGAVSPRWVGRAYWGLLVLVLAGLVASTQVRVADVARGPGAGQSGAASGQGRAASGQGGAASGRVGSQRLIGVLVTGLDPQAPKASGVVGGIGGGAGDG